jgi:uroporphyrinogen III methyltransferase/synthase
LSVISRKLLDLGWPPTLPAAVIQWGSWAHQRTVRGTLADIARRVKQEGLGAPAVIVIGAVAGLGKKLDWFEKRPLFGKTVLVTRARDQASALTSLLEEAGAHVIESPLIAIHALPLDKKGRGFLKNLSITPDSSSPAQMEPKFWRAHHLKERPCPPLYAIGEKTAAALQAEGLSVRANRRKFSIGRVGKRVGSETSGKTVLVRPGPGGAGPHSNHSGPSGRAGGPVASLRNATLGFSHRGRKRRLLSGEVDAVTFTSSSTVTSFMKNFTPRERRRIFSRTRARLHWSDHKPSAPRRGRSPLQAPGVATVEDLARAVVRALGRT